MYLSSQKRSPNWNQYMDPLLLTIGSLYLGETSRFLIVLLPLKWVCMPYLPQIFLILSQTLCVGYDNVTIGFDFIGRRLGTGSALVVSPIRSLPRRPFKSSLHLVQSLFGIFALCYCIPEVGLLFAEKLRIATNCLGPGRKGVDSTKFS